jgi:hypothetical protein
MNTEKINYDSSSDEEDELMRIINKNVATSGLEKALSISIGELNMSDYQVESLSSLTSTRNLQKPDTLNYQSFWNDNSNKIVYRINPELITNKKGKKVFFGGKSVDYPPNFHKWNRSTQDNWKNAVRHEALRSVHISLLRDK